MLFIPEPDSGPPRRRCHKDLLLPGRGAERPPRADRAWHECAPRQRLQTLTTTGTVPNGKKKMPAVLIKPVSITKSNYTQLFTSGFLKKSDVCNGAYAKCCK